MQLLIKIQLLGKIRLLDKIQLRAEAQGSRHDRSSNGRIALCYSRVLCIDIVNHKHHKSGCTSRECMQWQ